MAWIESHQEIGQHPKTRKAARLAGTTVPAMVGHLHLIWHWALDFAQEGDVSAYEPWQIEDAAMWDGDEGKLFAALVSSGYIDANKDNGFRLHDWYDYAGKLIERRRADAARKRGESGRNPTPPAPKPDGLQRNSDGTPTDGGENPSVTVTPTVTVTLTEPEPTEERPPNPPGGTEGEGEKPKPEKPKRPRNDYPEDFEAFWQAYPTGYGIKGKAFDQWQRIQPDDELFAEIMAGLERWKGCERWENNYIKAAEIWLRDSYWANEPPPRKVMAFNGNRPAESPNGEPKHWNGAPLRKSDGLPTAAFFAWQASTMPDEDQEAS